MAPIHPGRYSAEIEGDSVLLLGMPLTGPGRCTAGGRSTGDAAHAARAPAPSRASGGVGIWHEIFLVPARSYEAICDSMPRIGLATVGGHVAIARRGQSAARRVGAMATDEVAVSS
jgi:Domain of unknown function (DUF4188)